MCGAFGVIVRGPFGPRGPRERFSSCSMMSRASLISSPCSCLAQMRRPNAIAAGRQYAVRIAGVLDRLVQLAQRVVVERVRGRAIVHECRMRAVLAPAVLRGDLDEP